LDIKIKDVLAQINTHSPGDKSSPKSGYSFGIKKAGKGLNVSLHFNSARKIL
jgi:hypothetical protein